MTTQASHQASGPLEEFTQQETLTGYVAHPTSEEFFIHGERVLDQMSQGSSYSALVLLTLTGKPAEPAQLTRFERALQLCAVMDIAEGPCHAARLARVQKAHGHGVASVACVHLAHRARHIMDHTTALQAWMRNPAMALRADRPRRLEQDPGDAYVERALRGYPDEMLAMLREHDPSLDECIVALLHVSGLTERWQKEAALTMAGLPLAMAEAFFAPSRLRDYPVNVPAFVYEG